MGGIMRLKNKKTGEIKDIDIRLLGTEPDMFVDSIAELNEDWEDYEEEPKEYYAIDLQGDIIRWARHSWDEKTTNKIKEIGNYFETEEEAEKAVERLRAWKRLKDKGFRFKDYKRKFDGFRRVDGSVFIEAELDDEGTIGMINELSICFGGEE